LSAKEEQGLFSALWEALASLRLTIGLLILLAVASIFGTVIPQNSSPEEYLQFYKVSTYKILKILGFLDMYHAGWFVFLLALLSLNLIICSLKRFRVTWKTFFQPGRAREDDPWKALPAKVKFFAKEPPEQCLSRCREVVTRFFKKPTVLEKSAAYQLFAEKQKASRLGVYCIHLSVLVILGGALIGSFFGFRGNMNLVEGEKENRVAVRSQGRIEPLGFSLLLENFTVKFYPSGAPQEFKSVVTILDGGRKVLTESIRVNHPLTYQGVSFYQANYGVDGLKKVILAVKDRETGQEWALPAPLKTRVTIPSSNVSFILRDFVPDMQGMGPALQAVLMPPDRSPENFWILKNHPGMGEKRPGRYDFRIQEIEPLYYSGLQVTRDPGVWVVWIGCFLMIGGFYLTFFMSHRRLWVRLTGKDAGTAVEIGGSSHKDRMGFDKEMGRIEQALKSQSGKMSMDSESRGRS
jgi:cytochrome c biogenesis protein